MLTRTQRQVYKYIYAQFVKYGKAPTYRQIAKKMRWEPSGSGAYRCVKSICERGFLAIYRGKISLVKRLSIYVTREFGYFALDHENLKFNGWPSLVDVGPQ